MKAFDAMCQLLALNANAPTAATFPFSGLSARGGATGQHVEGWGMAAWHAFAPGELRVFVDGAGVWQQLLHAAGAKRPDTATANVTGVQAVAAEPEGARA
ncbi:class II glutamine amidotransferase [uncultured Azohydromonas sp.]|jgi:Predicted glutamine amidotransferase|uniref:class II glutamine amidotransferase n=1 Tax=uncultured Azohydromonas sp. TaxID=487342 RepID=UPI002635725A|nr:class II glutamine amidotransferase [uncultured Azohydromonas sp.]